MLDQEMRRGRITASKLGAIVGLSPWCSPLQAWLEISGRSERFDNPAMAWGRKLEAIIADEYAAREGVTLVEPSTLVHPRHDWLCGTPDRLVVGRPERGLECKAANHRQAYRWGPSESDAIPEEYIAQVTGYMAITGRPEWDVAALIDGNDFRIYRLQRDEQLEGVLLEAAERFYRTHVAPDISPPIDGGDSAREYLSRAYPREMGDMLEATVEATELATALRDVRHQRVTSEEREQFLENQLKALIGEAAGLRGPWGKITWKATKGRPVTDWKAIAGVAAIPKQLIEKHTRLAPARVFRPSFTEEE